MVFRSTAALGPQLEDHAAKFHWDPEDVDASYRLGNPEYGSDGHLYVLVQAAGDLDAEDTVTINESTWVATAGAGNWEVPAGIEGGSVAEGEYFHARQVTLGDTDTTA